MGQKRGVNDNFKIKDLQYEVYNLYKYFIPPRVANP